MAEPLPRQLDMLECGISSAASMVVTDKRLASPFEQPFTYLFQCEPFFFHKTCISVNDRHKPRAGDSEESDASCPLPLFLCVRTYVPLILSLLKLDRRPADSVTLPPG